MRTLCVKKLNLVFHQTSQYTTDKIFWMQYYALKKTMRVFGQKKNRRHISLEHVIRDFRYKIKLHNPSYALLDRKDICFDGVAYSIPCNANTRKNVIATLNSRVREARKARKHIRQTDHYFKGHMFYKTNGVHMHSNFSAGIVKAAKIEKLYKSKKPKNTQPHIGIEIEFLSPLNRQAIADRLCDFNLQDHVNLRDDGSLRPSPKHFGHELCILTTEKELKNIMIQIQHFLGSVEAYINSSCGMHVHIDMRDRDRIVVFQNLVSAQPVLYAMCPKSRKTSRFCRPIKKREFHMPEDRYRGINPHSLNRHGTIEVRIHSGTVNATKIYNWVRLLLAISKAAPIPVQIRSLKTLEKYTGIDKKLLAYIKKRIQKFKNPESADVDQDHQCDLEGILDSLTDAA